MCPDHHGYSGFLLFVRGGFKKSVRKVTCWYKKGSFHRWTRAIGFILRENFLVGFGGDGQGKIQWQIVLFIDIYRKLANCGGAQYISKIGLRDVGSLITCGPNHSEFDDYIDVIEVMYHYFGAVPVAVPDTIPLPNSSVFFPSSLDMTSSNLAANGSKVSKLRVKVISV
jgi:hypothetical protein